MTAHAEPTGTPSEPPGQDGKKSQRDPLSAAKITMFGGIATATITAAATIFTVIGPGFGNGQIDSSTATVQSSSEGSIDQVQINRDDTEVTVAGTAAPGVESVLVTIGPRDSEGKYWVNTTEVFAQGWRLVVDTEPQLSRPYEIKAYYKQRSVRPAAFDATSEYASNDPGATPTPAPPGDIVDCVVVHGDSCFQGQPEWSSPSIVRSGQ